VNRLQRNIDRFRKNPTSVWKATAAITSVSVVAVVLGAVLVRVFDKAEYPTFGKALWFTLQTVTTVGYGDVTPTRAIGRVVAAVVMLVGIGVISVVTASITSMFVQAARAEGDRSRHAEDLESIARIESALHELNTRLDRFDSTVDSNQQDPEE
jgi:voltage-gated potassium channel